MKYYVYGDTAGNYYVGIDHIGNILWETEYLKATLFTDDNVGEVPRYIKEGLNLYSFEVPLFPKLEHVGDEEAGEFVPELNPMHLDF